MNVTKEPPEDMSWTSRLTAGDCLDGKSGTGEWEIIVIDEVSSNGSEVYVTWGSGPFRYCIF